MRFTSLMSTEKAVQSGTRVAEISLDSMAPNSELPKHASTFTLGNVESPTDVHKQSLTLDDVQTVPYIVHAV
jgi:hypothetical protein